MQLENRYFVVKLKDLPDEIPPEIRHAFLTITQYVKECRQRRGKQPLDCIVVEKHWPEYQLALDAIAHRVDGTSPWQPIDYSQKDKAPLDGTPVFIKKEGFIAAAKWIDGRWSVCGRHIVQGRDEATHWMPVPEFMKG